MVDEVKIEQEQQISTWFQEVNFASLRLPSGLFGRPYDTSVNLRRVEREGRNIELSFNEGDVLSIRGLKRVTSEPKALSLESVGRITWEWRSGGTPLISNEFESGVVQFLLP